MKEKVVYSMLSVVVAAVFIGCATAPLTPAKDEHPGQPPLKVGVYADRGPSGIGALEWFRLIQESPEMELRLLDGKAVREGGLDGLDLFVMPGGASKTEYDTLGTNGVERMKAFVRNGGGYIGTCAGCCLLMDEPTRRARMVPWRSSGSEPHTMFLSYKLTPKGAAALGLKEGPHVFRYHGGPFLWPTTNKIEGASIELWGTFNAEGTNEGRLNAAKKMHGSGCILGGTYGKGRIFVTSAHPEYFESTLYLVKAAFKYVAGREVTFPVRARSPRAVSVGFLAKGISGVTTAKTALALAAEKDFDLVLIDLDGIRQRRLDHLDVLVLTNASLAKNAEFKKALDGFMSRGGKVVGYGGGAKILPPGGIACGPLQETVQTIHRLFP
ncbi:MAG: hypothetical protein J5985_01370 [Kiritimatiellae bacterium]|nr:hypothetical protein [Kiritimatiellia bacterium]